MEMGREFEEDFIKGFFSVISKEFIKSSKQGKEAIKTTFRGAFKSCKKNYKMLTRLTNLMCNLEWYYWDKFDLDKRYEKESQKIKEIADTYHKLWREVVLWSKHNLEGRELKYFLDNATVE